MDSVAHDRPAGQIDLDELMAAACTAAGPDDDPFGFLWDDETLPPDWPEPPARAPEPLIPFADWIECQAAYFRSLGSGAGAWLAGRLAADAATARLVAADSPAAFDAAEAELVESHHAGLRAEGYDRACDDFGPARF